MRRRFEAVLGEAVRDNIVLLGVSFRGARNRAMTSKEQSRIQRATNIACKASVLPDYSGKLHVVTQMACSAASWGWIFRPPNVKTCRAFKVAWRRAGLAPTRSNPAMARLLLGHGVDLNFVSGTMALSALMRAARQQHNIDRTSVIFQRVSTWMQKLGWRYLRLSLRWKRGSEDISLRDDIEGAKHKLREGWRQDQWQHWNASGRLEVRAAGVRPYDAVRVKKACKLAGNRHFLAVLSGASISPARMAATGTFEDHSCPFCGGQWATRWHLFWGCPNNNRTVEIPQDELQRQLGFPSALRSDNYNRQVLEHMASIRRTMITTNWRRRRLVGG